MSSIQSPATIQDWQQALEQGRVHEALTFYLRCEQQNAAVVDALQALLDLRTHLRAKRWRKAQQVVSTRLEEASVPVGSEAASAEFGWQTLQQQIDLLQESAEVLDRRDPDAALALLARVEHPVLRAEVETQRGTAFIFRNELAEASACFEQALTYDPKHYRAMTNQGNLALEAGHLDEAIAAYEQALKINEDFSNAHHNLGVAYRKKGDITRSVASIRKAQRALRQEETERARGSLSRSTRGLQGKTFRWLIYGALFVLVVWWLQGQGFF